MRLTVRLYLILSSLIVLVLRNFSRLEDKVDVCVEFDEGLADVDKVLSCEDTQVLKLWDDNVEFVEGHYELPIPWKDDVYVPNNFQVAESRLRC